MVSDQQGVKVLPAWVWAAVGVLLMLLESLHGAFILSILGAAALVVAALSWLVPISGIQLVAWAALSLVGLWLVRPVLTRRWGKGRGAPTNVAALVGQRGVVVAPFDPRRVGRVRVGGETWRAHLVEGCPVPPEGAELAVVGSQGATLEVLF